ncbi:MAG: hypothetical protein SPF07_00180 [Eubacteriales bacterium]|nr:hypothetical protein [Eubacteriales bacterium]
MENKEIKEFDQFLIDLGRINLDRAEKYILNIENLTNKLLIKSCKSWLFYRKREDDKARQLENEIFESVLECEQEDAIMQFVKGVFFEKQGNKINASLQTGINTYWYRKSYQYFKKSLESGISQAGDEIYKSRKNFMIMRPKEYIEFGLKINPSNPSLILDLANVIWEETNNIQEYLRLIVDSLSLGNVAAMDAYVNIVFSCFESPYNFNAKQKTFAVILATYLLSNNRLSENNFNRLIKVIQIYLCQYFYIQDDKSVFSINVIDLAIFIVRLLYNTNYKQLAMDILSVMLRNNYYINQRNYLGYLISNESENMPVQLKEQYKDAKYNSEDYETFKKWTNKVDLNEILSVLGIEIDY